MLPVWLAFRCINVLFAPADIAPLLSPCPVVLAVRNLWPYTQSDASSNWTVSFRRITQRWLAGLSCRKARRVIFVSQASADLLSKRLNVLDRKQVVIRHGLASIFRLTDSSARSVLEGYNWGMNPYVLCVSDVYRHKNLETLISGFALWRQRTGDKQRSLLFAGAILDTDYFEYLQHLANSQRIEQRVHFVGNVPYADMPALYQGAELFVFPSILETFGHPLVEAMACGVPVIASDLPVCREICQDAARYFPIDDPEALSKHLLVTLSDPTVRQAMAKKGLERAKSFSWDRTAMQLVQVFEEMNES